MFRMNNKIAHYNKFVMIFLLFFCFLPNSADADVGTELPV